MNFCAAFRYLWEYDCKILTYKFLLLLSCRNFHLEILFLQVCERSLTSSTGGPTGPPSSNFVRAEVLPSGYLIRPCEGGGSIIHIVDHVDLDVRNTIKDF